MNIANQLPVPLNTFVLDVPANEYYDFELAPGSTYPLPGVTYSVDYGHILGYFSEDGHEFDLFVGNDPIGECGSVLVFRGDDRPNEHKFYIGLTKEEREQITSELKPVLIEHEIFKNTELLLKELDQFKEKSNGN